MIETKPEIKDIEVDSNTVRFINVREGKKEEPSIVIESGVKKVARKQPSKGVKAGRPDLKFPTDSYSKEYEIAFKLNKREKSFQIETVLDTKLSKIYELLDKHNVPIDDQLKIHHEIIEMLNTMEVGYK